jgi:hypothetical protein
MTSKKQEVSLIQRTLKKILATRELGYDQMAVELGVSLSTAKRLLNHHDPSLEMLLDVCAWLGMEFHEVVEMSRRHRQEYLNCTLAQEEFLAAHLEHLAVLRLLQKGQSPATIAANARLKPGDVDAYLADLEVQQFIEVQRSGKIRLIVGDGMDWRVDGPLRRAFLGRLLDGLVEHYLNRDAHGTESFIDFGHKILTAESYAAMKKELDELSRKYGAMSRIEPRLHGADQVRTYTYVMLFDDWVSDLWDVKPYPRRRQS